MGNCTSQNVHHTVSDNDPGHTVIHHLETNSISEEEGMQSSTEVARTEPSKHSNSTTVQKNTSLIANNLLKIATINAASEKTPFQHNPSSSATLIQNREITVSSSLCGSDVSSPAKISSIASNSGDVTRQEYSNSDQHHWKKNSVMNDFRIEFYEQGDKFKSIQQWLNENILDDESPNPLLPLSIFQKDQSKYTHPKRSLKDLSVLKKTLSEISIKN